MNYTALFWFFSEARDGQGELHRTLELPFAPVPGQAIRFPGAEQGVLIEQVVWDAERRRFQCELCGQRDLSLDWASMVAVYQKLGWDVSATESES